MTQRALNQAGRAGRSNFCHVVQGEFKVSDDPDLVMTTILGSCVATCLCDPVARVGGMNHFLLPDGNSGNASGYRYGALAMELLINALMKLGADKSRLEAKLFGGGRMTNSLARIGDANCKFATEFLQSESIRIVSQSLGGTKARRIRFTPATGSAQQMLLEEQVETDLKRKQPAAKANDDVTLF